MCNKSKKSAAILQFLSDALVEHLHPFEIFAWFHAALELVPPRRLAQA
jgi:hypothetical protein